MGLGALFAFGMMAVTEVMKRRGNIENAEEFTGSFPLPAPVNMSLTIHSCQKITGNWLDRCWCNIILDMEYHPSLLGHSCVRVWSRWIVFLRCVQQYSNYDIQQSGHRKLQPLLSWTKLLISQSNAKGRRPMHVHFLRSSESDMARSLIGLSCSSVWLRIFW